MRRLSRILCAAAVALGAVLTTSEALAQDKLKGAIKVDGSSTVYLVTEAVAVNFKKLHPRVDISIGISGTGGGFKKFAAGETDINDASRAIKAQEAEACKKNNINYVELQVGWDGLAVIVHKENTWATKMTMEQLKRIWHPDTAAQKWSDVDPSWPDKTIQLYGAGTDSGTFDYFTEAVNGKEKLIRKDYTASEDDNTTINGVVRNKHAMGFLGLAYAEAHVTKLHMVALKGEKSKSYVEPSLKTVLNRSYPISRPLFIYVRTDSLKRPEVHGFVDYYLRHPELVSQVKYVPLTNLQQTKVQEKFQKAVKGL
jgi:phosphate transport system substrate-binding protein